MQNTTLKLQACAVCKETGKFGAKWLFFVGDARVPQVVHKPCGEMLQKSAPAGTRTNLVPSRQLRDEWRERRLTQNFWDTAFGNAKPLKKSATPVAALEPAPALAA